MNMDRFVYKRKYIPEHLRETAHLTGKAGSFSDTPLRTVQYWTERGLVEPDISSTTGTGSKRLFSVKNCIEIAIIKSLAEQRMHLKEIKIIMTQLRTPYREHRLIKPGKSIYRTLDYTYLDDLLCDPPGIIVLAYSRDEKGKMKAHRSTILKSPSEESWIKVTNPQNRDYEKLIVIDLTEIAKRVLEKMA